MVDEFLNKHIVASVFADMPLDKFIESAVDPTYEGLCILRPSLEDVGDRYYESLVAGQTILKLKDINASQYSSEPLFEVVSSTSRYHDDTMRLPYSFVQKFSVEDYRPWKENTVVSATKLGEWLIVVDYIGNGEIVLQELETGQIKSIDLKDLSHGKNFVRYGDSPFPVKGKHGVKINKKQAEETGLPEGTIVPFLEFQWSIDEVLCKIHGTDKLYPYDELDIFLSYHMESLVKSI